MEGHDATDAHPLAPGQLASHLQNDETARQVSSGASSPSGPRGIEKRPSEHSVSATLEGVEILAHAGSWDAVARLVNTCLASEPLPHVALKLRLYRIVALLRLRQHQVAAEELKLLGDLDSPHHHFEHFPKLYPGKTGSIMPFSMRIMQAQMPHYFGNTWDAIGSMQRLLKRCETESDQAQVVSGENACGAPPNLTAARLGLANLYVTQQEYGMAADLLQALAKTHPEDENVVCMLGRVYLQMGNIRAAQDVYDRHECAVEDADNDAVVRSNRGLVALACGDYATGHDEFSAVLRLSPSNAIAANNKAICLLYLGRISEAIDSLEAFIHADPKKHFDATMYANLCSMYELQSDHGARKKQALTGLASEVGSDDVDLGRMRGTLASA